MCTWGRWEQACAHGTMGTGVCTWGRWEQACAHGDGGNRCVHMGTVGTGMCTWDYGNRRVHMGLWEQACAHGDDGNRHVHMGTVGTGMCTWDYGNRHVHMGTMGTGMCTRGQWEQACAHGDGGNRCVHTGTMGTGLRLHCCFDFAGQRLLRCDPCQLQLMSDSHQFFRNVKRAFPLWCAWNQAVTLDSFLLSFFAPSVHTGAYLCVCLCSNSLGYVTDLQNPLTG